MKLKIQIQNVAGKDLMTNYGIGNMDIELEADFTNIDNALFNPDTQAKFQANQQQVLSFFSQDKEIVSDAVECIVGGFTKGIINAIDQQISPIAKLRGRIMGLLIGWGLLPNKKNEARNQAFQKWAEQAAKDRAETKRQDTVNDLLYGDREHVASPNGSK